MICSFNPRAVALETSATLPEPAAIAIPPVVSGMGRGAPQGAPLQLEPAPSATRW